MKLFIPIKENSQRVPGKNFRLLGDVPLYKYVLRKFNMFDIYVDTDSEKLMDEIIEDSTLTHVIPFMRSPKLIGDDVSVSDLISNFLNTFILVKGVICQLHVTSPFLTPKTLAKALDTYLMNDNGSVVSCNKLQTRLWRKESYGFTPVNHNPLKLQQTQDLPILYEENSAFYIFDADKFRKTNNRVDANPYFMPIFFPENVDIDTEDDWRLCEALYHMFDKDKQVND